VTEAKREIGAVMLNSSSLPGGAVRSTAQRDCACRQPCPACASTTTSLELRGLRDRQYPHHDIGQCYDYARCLQCGCLFMTPCPTHAQILGFYPTANEYYAYDSQKAPAVYRAAQSVSRWRYLGSRALGRILPFVAVHPPGTVLDVGCGSAHFLDFMKSQGWTTWGMDISEEATRNAKPSHRIVTNPNSADAQLPADYFDLVTLFQVLEHIPNPVASLTNLAKSLRPGGLLVVNTPNAGGFLARRFGADWRGLECPRHVVLYTPASLAAALGRSGLALAGTHCRPAPTDVVDSFQLRYEGVGGRQVRAAAVARRTAVALLMPWAFLAPLLGDADGGSLLTVAARRPGWSHEVV
jgi:2-polyprenyl-3-methyl-5-hydroxy-6-metoxy-1,4-benzoquinol methylase